MIPHEQHFGEKNVIRLGWIHCIIWILGISCSSQPEIMSTTPTSTSPYTSTTPNQGPYGQYRSDTENPTPTTPPDSTKSDPRHSDKPEKDPTKDDPNSKIGSGRDESPTDLASVVKPKTPANGTGPNGTSSADSTKPTGTTTTRAGVGFDQVLPILSKNCNSCHNPNGRSPDLTVYSRARAVGPAIIRTAASDSPTMPEGNTKLNAKDKETLRSWKDSGYIEASK